MMSIVSVSVCYTHNSRSSIGYIWIAPAPGGRGRWRKPTSAPGVEGEGGWWWITARRWEKEDKWSLSAVPHFAERPWSSSEAMPDVTMWHVTVFFELLLQASWSLLLYSLSQTSNYIFGGHPWRWNVGISASGSQLDVSIWPSRYSCRWNAALKFLSPFQSLRKTLQTISFVAYRIVNSTTGTGEVSLSNDGSTERE